MYERMIDDMDLDAGTILAGRGVEEVGREIFEEIIAVASGKHTKSEQHGIGQEEFVPWQHRADAVNVAAHSLFVNFDPDHHDVAFGLA